MRRSLIHAVAATAVSATVMIAAAATDADTNIDTGSSAWKGLIVLSWLWVLAAWAACVVIQLARAVRRLSRRDDG